ncbi:MAG: GNAT family N-acetyltransferase [candidate division KSB1 bacterium]|jgi:ribosomal protein S18 acetylase RimI-like enzyme|nr:GNAT family N-acetyltransferase [candidate division KSB1 bacterium]
MDFDIRVYHPCDLTSLYRICLKTGNSGEDASDMYADPDLPGHFFAAPYAVLEPELCFILTRNGEPCGYILGTRDSQAFSERCEQEWYPLLRSRYPMPSPDDTSYDARIIRLIHEGYHPREDVLAYPAHLHIDILPAGQGRGFGRTLMARFIDVLEALKVLALHLEVGKANPGAIQFYERVGFHRIREYDKSIAFGMRLSGD